MCGIVGAIAARDVTPILLEGLKRLEYRGYDSAGIVLLVNGKLERCRIKGKIQDLIASLKENPLVGTLGIAHTRWATHGAPSELNAHPHISSDSIAIVHNGIIENYEILKSRLLELGYVFRSETDTEVIAHLLHAHLQHQKDLRKAIQYTVKELKGAYALGIINIASPDCIFAVRSGSPLVIGLGDKENFIASDSLALLPVTQRFIYLEEGDIAEIYRDKVKIFNKEGQGVERSIRESAANIGAIDKGKYRHFMQKEIFEQPLAIINTLEGRIYDGKLMEASFGSMAKEIFSRVENITMIACGTSYHAAMVARYWLEEMAQIPCIIDIASEYRYRKGIVRPNTLFVTISQSGETADTLAALRLAKEQKYLAHLAICNVPDSSLVRESELVFMTRAGVEIGVASTKAFTTQLVSLLLLTLALGRSHQLKEEQEKQILSVLMDLPRIMQSVLNQGAQLIEKLSKSFADKQHTLFLGRGSLYPVALEGALKLKEISYIHAEAYPAGELKHGPLALVDSHMPVIAVAPNNKLIEKLKSNLQEVEARGGRLIVFADKKAAVDSRNGIEIIPMPEVNDIIAPIVYTLPLQLLAYHVALIKGTDVDQPRNLAKSVTVE